MQYKSIKDYLLICALNLGATSFVASGAHAQSGFNFLKDLKSKAEQAVRDTANQAQQGSSSNSSAPSSVNLGSTTVTSPIDSPYDRYTGPLPPPPVASVTRSGRTLGRILFSKKKIVPGKENKDGITNKFQVGDEVHVAAYMPADLKTLNFGRSFSVRFINYDEQGFAGSYQQEDSKWLIEKRSDGTDPATENFLAFELFSPVQGIEYPNMTRILMDRVNGFIVNKWNEDEDKIYRTHKVTVNIYAHGEPVAEGEFFYTITRDKAAAFNAMYQTHLNKQKQNFKLAASKRTDPALAAKISAVMRQNGVTVSKVLFDDTDWFIVRHNISGAVLRREINATLISKKSATECQYQERLFAEEYIDSGFTNLRINGVGLGGGDVLCANVP